VDHAVAEIDRQFLASPQHVLDALVSGVSAGEELARQQKPVTRFPRGDFVAAEGIQIYSSRLGVGGPRYGRPVGKIRRLELRGARAVEHEMRVPRRGAVRDHGDRTVRGMGRISSDL